MVDMYKCTDLYGEEVDLDDLTIYPERLLKLNTRELFEYCWTIMGKSLVYMQFFYPDIFKDDPQTIRVRNYCQRFAWMRKKYMEDTPENRLLWLKLIYRFDDEVENQC